MRQAYPIQSGTRFKCLRPDADRNPRKLRRGREMDWLLKRLSVIWLRLNACDYRGDCLPVVKIRLSRPGIHPHVPV